MKYTIVKFTAKQLDQKGYCGERGGAISGSHYAIMEEGKGLISLDEGRTVYLLKGKSGFNAMQKIIDMGGFVGNVDYLPTI